MFFSIDFIRQLIYPQLSSNTLSSDLLFLSFTVVWFFYSFLQNFFIFWCFSGRKCWFHLFLLNSCVFLLLFSLNFILMFLPFLARFLLCSCFFLFLPSTWRVSFYRNWIFSSKVFTFLLLYVLDLPILPANHLLFFSFIVLIFSVINLFIFSKIAIPLITILFSFFFFILSFSSHFFLFFTAAGFFILVLPMLFCYPFLHFLQNSNSFHQSPSLLHLRYLWLSSFVNYGHLLFCSFVATVDSVPSFIFLFFYFFLPLQFDSQPFLSRSFLLSLSFSFFLYSSILHCFTFPLLRDIGSITFLYSCCFLSAIFKKYFLSSSSVFSFCH